MSAPHAYYNEHDPFAVEWLCVLIEEGLIAEGDVDPRDIQDVVPSDLKGYAQCHFFAGIGGWSYALRLAGWPDDQPVWTGSCPCQPFSTAGKQHGVTDPRHLWPVWSRLIRECRPVTVFGEQVESAIAHGWLDLVFDDLEREGYACGAAGLPAASVGASHLRQRVWFVAESESQHDWRGTSGARRRAQPANSGDVGLVAESDGGQPVDRGLQRSGRHLQRAEDEATGERLADTEHAERRPLHVDRADGRHGPDEGRTEAHGEPGTCGEVRAVGNADEPGSQRRIVHGERPGEGFWDRADWIVCRDGKARPVEPSTFPLAHGVSGRVGRLRGYGNAIVPEVAAAFIGAYQEVTR